MKGERTPYESAAIMVAFSPLGADEVALNALIARAKELKAVNCGDGLSMKIPLRPQKGEGTLDHYLDLTIDPIANSITYQLFKDGQPLFIQGHLQEVFEIRGDRHADPEMSTLIFRSKNNRGLLIYPGRIRGRCIWPHERF